MHEHLKIQLKVTSLLLQYPDEGFIRSLPSIASSLAHVPDSPARDKLVQFISYLQTTPLLCLQETYTEIFDLNPSTCLNLSYHLLGDSEKRGKVMAGLQQIYLEAGYEPISGELPDYLPLMLEFLSESPESGGAGRLWSYLGAVEKPAALLKDSGTPYWLLLDIVGDIVRERSEDCGLRSEDSIQSSGFGVRSSGKQKLRRSGVGYQRNEDRGPGT